MDGCFRHTSKQVEEEEKGRGPPKRAITVVTTSGPGDEAEKVEEFLRTDLHNLGFGIYRSMIYSDNGGRNPACDNDQLLLDAKKVGQGLQTLDLQ